VQKAFDFSNLESDILKSIERLTHGLAELRAGGRLSPTALEVLPVKLDDSSDSLKIRDLAQVVSKGQYIHIILSDEAVSSLYLRFAIVSNATLQHIKAVRSAINSSTLSLAPQGPTEDAPTTLTVKIPPQTGESRQAVVKNVKVASDHSLDMIKHARHDKHDQLRKMKADKSLRADDYQKAHDEMEKVVKRGNEEVKRISDGARRVFEG